MSLGEARPLAAPHLRRRAGQQDVQPTFLGRVTPEHGCSFQPRATGVAASFLVVLRHQTVLQPCTRPRFFGTTPRTPAYQFPPPRCPRLYPQGCTMSDVPPHGGNLYLDISAAGHSRHSLMVCLCVSCAGRRTHRPTSGNWNRSASALHR